MLNFYSVWNMSWFVLGYSSPLEFMKYFQKIDKKCYFKLLRSGEEGNKHIRLRMVYAYERVHL